MAAIYRSDVTLSSFLSLLLKCCFQHHLKVFTVVCCLGILINATPHFLEKDPQLSDEDMMLTLNKRPARLSYFRSPHGSSRRRPSRFSSYYSRSSHRSPYRSSYSYGSSGHGRYASRGGMSRVGGRAAGRGSRFLSRFGGYGKNEWWRKKSINNRYMMPWDRLPNTNCLRETCRSDADCCRRFSKCHKSARVCIDCWYGYPCKQDTDCCARYPYCNKVLKTCTQ